MNRKAEQAWTTCNCCGNTYLQGEHSITLCFFERYPPTETNDVRPVVKSFAEVRKFFVELEKELEVE